MDAVLPTKVKSTHAQVSAQIRAELKKRGVKAIVRSRSGCVTVTTEDLCPRTANEISDFVGKYELGYFDGMTDSYVYSNRNDDLPQVRFVNYENCFSAELKQKALDNMKDRAPDWFVGVPMNVAELGHWHRDKYNNFVSEEMYRVLKGESSWSTEIWSKDELPLDYIDC